MSKYRLPQLALLNKFLYTSGFYLSYEERDNYKDVSQEHSQRIPRSGFLPQGSYREESYRGLPAIHDSWEIRPHPLF